MSANLHTEPLRATNQPFRHYYTPPDTVSRRPKPPAAAGKTLDAGRSSRTTTTSSPGDIAGRCTALAVALVSVTASAPPVTTAAPRRTRRSPPRVLFLECAGSCSCACPLRAPALSPTIDAGQGPAPRPGISVATGLHRMSARPTDHSGQPPRAGEIAKEKCSSFAKTQPAPHPASALILAWTLTRSCTPMELKPADRLAASTSMTLQDQKDAGRSPSPTPGGPALHPRPRFARPRPLLGPPNRTHRRRHRCESTTRRNMPPDRRCLQRRLWTFPNAAIQARATSVNSCQKNFSRRTHTAPLSTTTSRIDARPSLYAALFTSLYHKLAATMPHN